MYCMFQSEAQHWVHWQMISSCSGVFRCLMLSSHCTIFARFFPRQQVLINRRQMPEIRGKSVLVHESDNCAVWIRGVEINSFYGASRCRRGWFSIGSVIDITDYNVLKLFWRHLLHTCFVAGAYNGRGGWDASARIIKNAPTISKADIWLLWTTW